MPAWSERAGRGHFALWSACLLGLLYVAFYWSNATGRFAQPVRAQSLQLVGFEASERGFVASSSAGSHVLAATIPIAAGEWVTYQIRVAHPSRTATTLRVDLFAPGYDNGEQERAHSIGYGAYPATIRGRFPAGNGAPETVQFRIFYDGAPGLSVGDIRVARIAVWRVWSEYVLGFATLVAFFATLARAIGSWLVKPQPTRRDALWVLVSLYGLGVIARFAISLWLPYWSGDEYAYKGIAAGLAAGGGADALHSERLAHSVDLPNLLYPWLIAPALSLGDGFYTGIRLINAVVMTLVVFPAFGIARRLAGTRVGLVAAAFALALPSANIAAYAVTEALYYPVVLTVLWLTQRAVELPQSIMRQLAVGVAIGIALNVRLTAIALLPAYLFAVLVVHLQSGQWRLLVARPTWLLGAVSAYVTSRAIQALSASSAGLGLYEGHSTGWWRLATQAMTSDPLGVATLLSGHAAILAVPYSLGIAALVCTFIGDGSSSSAARRDAVVVLIGFLAAFALAIVFTLSVSASDLGGLGRWHSRYYFTYLPLLVASGAAWLGRPRQSSRASPSAIVILIIVLAAATSFVTFTDAFRSPWFGSMVDSMEAQWMHVWGARGFAIVALIGSITVAIAWARRAPEYFIAGLVIWLGFANVATWRTLRNSPGADDAQCGAVVSKWLQANPGTVTAVASSREGLVDLVFWLPHLPQRAITVAEGATISPKLTAGSDFVAVEGSASPTNAVPVLSIGRCKIFEKRPL